ncbi:MAG: SpaH/EbpB family LPXTG-anchored major pilin [Clostridiaceae bacterium]|nr:SpaH/EbpB family LPXTG-anchored major pilin [Clostridia bacterium]MDY3871133.1 SpaH/EbpB family LPXTG-anchored major pilin [Clostridiaceae bacterium]
MKHTKKLASLLLALALAFALAVPAMAAGGTYSITINNTTPGYTYAAYQIFTGRLEDGVLSDIQWGSGVTSDDLLTALKDNSSFVEGTGEAAKNIFAGCKTAADVAEAMSGVANNSDRAKAFAEVVGAHLTTETAGTFAENKNGDVTTNYTISGLAAGYYLVKNTGVPDTDGAYYTNYILQVVENSEVNPKGSVPSVDKNIGTVETIKTVVNGADYNIGDDVPFTLAATLPENLSTYESYKVIFHDTLPAGLTYNANSAKVYVINDDIVTEVKSGYGVGSNGNPLTVTIADVFALKAENNADISVDKDSKIVVEYTAKLNTNAEIGQPGNKNEVYLEYSNDPNWDGTGSKPEPTGNTPKDEVLVFTYELDVTKVDGKDNTTKLQDAKFVLYREVSVEGQEGITKEYVIVDANGKVIGWTGNAYGSTETKKASVLTSGENGLFKVIGLDAGTYFLEEIVAPTGYNMLEKPIKIVITATVDASEDSASLDALTITVDDGTATAGNLDSGIVATTVKNNKGATLPETGGMGTTLFYVLGGVLVVGAVVLLITKKRMGAEQ